MPSKTFDSYVPRVASDWDAHAKDSLWRSVEGTLLFVDISGFTNLSERLARKGRIGAEELTSVLNRVFGQMLDIAYDRGGSLLKFGGDALLLLFQTSDHVMQATAAAVEMRAALREASREPTSVGRINLKMSSGIHTGSVDFFLVGESHRELIVTGPTASITTEMEGTADANEIVVSGEVAQILPSDFTRDQKGDGWLLRKQKIHHPVCGLVTREAIPTEEMAEFVSSGLRNHLSAGIAEPEHRISTIGFVKFKGIDKLLEGLGPEKVGEALDELVPVVQRAADREGITFLASDIDADGGKLILSAGVPTSRADDEGRMLRAAREILDADTELGVRIGVNRGHVFSGEVGNAFRRTYTVMGDTVNLAARLMAAADTGMLYASPGVLDRSSTLFRTEALEPFQVKGKEKPVQAYAVFEETGIRPPELEQGLPFHGRDAERDMIVQIITTCARSGRGGMMTITGNTGLGKTRLISEVLADCPGLDTLMVQAEPNGSDNPYWAFRDPLRRLLEVERAEQSVMASELEKTIGQRAPNVTWAIPLFGDVMHIEVPENDQTADIDPKFRPERTADAIIELLETLCTGPFAAIGEDGHWMDEASIALLRRIGEAASQRPWTVIFTARKERSDFEPLGDEVPLHPLEDEAVRTIVIEATAAAPLRPHELDAVVARAGGNPLFLSEIINMIRETGSADELPESLDAVVSSEIDTLPTLTRQLLRYASVLGRSFPRFVLNELLAPEELELDEATEKELGRFLDADGDARLRFRHAVVHDVAYQGLSYRRRRELHARAAEVVESLNSDDPDGVAEFLAFHYSESGNWDKVWHYARVAGQKAGLAYANVEAASQYRRALEAARWIDADEDERARVHEYLGDVLDRLGAFEQAIKSYRQAQHTYEDPERQAKSLYLQALMMQKMGQLSRALRTLTRGEKIAASNNSKQAALSILAQKASIKQYQGKHKKAQDLAQEALKRAGDTASKHVAIAEMITDLARTALGTADDHSPSWRALDIAEEIGNLDLKASILNNLGMFAYFEGNWGKAVEFYERSTEEFQKTGDAIAAAYGQANSAEILSEQGHLEDADRRYLELLPVFRSAGDLRLVAGILTHRGRIEIRRGKTDSALRLLDEAQEMYESMKASAERVEVLLRRAEALLLAGRLNDAGMLLENESGLSPERAPAQLKPLAHRVNGLNSWLSGEHEDGLRHLHEALAIATDLGSDVDEVAAIHMLAATGSIDAGLTHRAAELSRKLGIVSVPLMRVRFAQSGISPRTHG